LNFMVRQGYHFVTGSARLDRPRRKALMNRVLSKFMLFAFLAFAGPVGAWAAGQAPDQSLLAMRALDQKVADIGHRLAVASRDLCAERQWLPGLALHDLSQYGAAFRPAAIRAFGLDAGPAVLALAAGGPAARAGLRLDDILLSLDGRPLPRAAMRRDGSFEQMELILQSLEAAFADGRAEVEVRRGGGRLTLTVEGEEGCASRFQLIPSRRLNARADGRYVQVTTAIADYVADDSELAAVLAHEFAHNVARHRVRLDEARVSRGFLGNFGRNARRIRETEVEADRLSVYLMERAGYDPEAAVRFWSRFGPRGLNFLGSPTHPNWRNRIRLFEAEIAAIRRARAAGAAPTPDFLRQDAAPAG
jgi:Zn-dependent protease with chaperone function